LLTQLVYLPSHGQDQAGLDANQADQQRAKHLAKAHAKDNPSVSAE